MNLTLRDFATMRLPIAVLVAVLVVSALMIKTSSLRHQTAEAERIGQTAALKEARERYERSGTEREAILNYLPAYRKLQSEGLVGEEQRIEWVESLRAANKQVGLFGIAYQIEARKPFVLVGQGSPAAQFLRETPMKLTFGLVHEADLMRFLEVLGAQKSGLFMLRRCAIDRPQRLDNPGPRQANLNAQCDLSWLTLDPPKATL